MKKPALMIPNLASGVTTSCQRALDHELVRAPMKMQHHQPCHHAAPRQSRLPVVKMQSFQSSILSSVSLHHLAPASYLRIHERGKQQSTNKHEYGLDDVRNNNSF